MTNNPKEAAGSVKCPSSCVPQGVIMEIGLGMMEGACKYGSHNYRETPISASVYFDALHRHMTAWWEGEDIDPDSGLNHVTKAITTLVVLRDAMLNDMLINDRPKPMPPLWMASMNAKAKEIAERYAAKK